MNNITTKCIQADELLNRFQKIRSFTEKICSRLQEDDFNTQPVQFVSPPKWHLAHTSWFFEEFILVGCKKMDYFNKQYPFLFNSYYETIGERVSRDARGSLSRPVLHEVKAYRTYIDEKVTELLSKGDIDDKITSLMLLGFNHEQQHQELLLTDIKYILGHNPMQPEFQDPSLVLRSAPSNQFIEIPSGVYQIGYAGEDFCFDNERGEHSVFLHDYRISRNTVTNGEYLEFILDKGYERPELWLADGWTWVKENAAKAPLYWKDDSDKKLRYSLNGIEPINEHDPVSHVSFYEADAYARWKNMRLPTEFEWEVAAKMHGSIERGNFADTGYYEPVGDGHEDSFMGNVWEWTNSAYLPYPYYKKPEGAVGEYNGKFMVNQMVLRGGSCATPKDHIRTTYRNFFYPQERWQFSGIRLAEHV
jgi:ergothioneine biosynthesis protein EgtB